jgi:putative FmdB family regulatory protein
MPLYEYLCEACGHRFENIQKFSDLPLEKCPKCGGHVHKMQAAPAFHLKGSGWYATDYAKKTGSSGSNASSDKTDSPAKSETADVKAEKADTKTEKADAKTEKAEKKESGTESPKPSSS